MHHVVVERWSRRRSPLHARDARVKILLLVAFLVALGTLPRVPAAAALAYGAVLIAGTILARLPVGALLWRSAIVLPFSAVLAALSLWAGDAARAEALVFKSYLSAFAVILVMGTTPLPDLLRGLESLGVPHFLVLVVQFLYRYLFVVSEEAQHMRLAAACRGSFRFRAAAGAVAVLFARSYRRAQGIYNAMLARGYAARFQTLALPHIRISDLLSLAGGIALIAALRLFPWIR